ncbi:transposase [Corynebacterium ulcerans]|uniref:IS110 family transposase n=1 Tax=Corynebacterium ulcerans TaxID=65058 RepID=UPI001E40CDAF|nr:IS110 family transposase [Corynebacterium ulcerans]MDK8888413.1 transposase [Corynebacterium ulcerans]
MTVAQILLAIGDGSDFDSAGHLTAYAGIAPVTGQSGSSIRGEYPARPGHKRQKHLVLLSIRYHPQPRAISQLLRTQANRRKAPQCGCNFFSPTSMQRHLHNAEKQGILPRNPGPATSNIKHNTGPTSSRSSAS